MDTQSLIEIIRKKVDMRMANLDPASTEYEQQYDIDGNYTVENLDLIKSGGNWTRSFFTGMVAYMYHHFKDEKYLKYLEDSYEPYYKYYEHCLEISCMMHDSGFIYSLYTAAHYAVSGNKKAYDLNYWVANEFAKRFRYKAGIVQGFGYPREKEAQTIIDDMMNLSLLMWAYRHTKHPYFEEILRAHVGTVFKVLLRDDFTLRHSYVFNSETGEPEGERNYCGYGPGSVWARGQTWGIYGLVNMIECFGPEDKFTVVLNGLINKYISYLPEDGVPLWDFSCVGSNQKDIMTDTSAGVAFASAMYKLDTIYNLGKFQGEAKNAVKYADKIMETVIEKYMMREDCECLITGGQFTSINCGCVWGDYFFTEAVMRKIYGRECPDFWN